MTELSLTELEGRGNNMKESKYVQLVRDRYEKDEMSYEEEGTLLFLLNGPDQYGNEDEMLKYAEEHPNISMEELFEYWDSITPKGLPPEMDPKELLDDDDEEDK